MHASPPRPRLFGRGSWPEARRIGDLLRTETTGGLLLVAAAALALLRANSTVAGVLLGSPAPPSSRRVSGPGLAEHFEHAIRTLHTAGCAPRRSATTLPGRARLPTRATDGHGRATGGAPGRSVRSMTRPARAVVTAPRTTAGCAARPASSVFAISRS